jgi:hypothetical protein
MSWAHPSASGLEGPVAPADAVNGCDDGHDGDGPDNERAAETAHPASRYFSWSAGLTLGSFEQRGLEPAGDRELDLERLDHVRIELRA